VRRIGLFQATAINMSQIVGIGPFVTIPLMVAAFGGPQAIIGWIAGAILALTDGLVWAELGAAMPGAGGSYIYLREAFQYRTGRLMPFLFTWTAILFIPLIMSTGVTGFVQVLGFVWTGMTPGQGDFVGLVMVIAVVALLWRRIDSIGRLTTAMWLVMLVAVACVILAAFTHFHPHLAFTYQAHALSLGTTHFWVGFAAGLTIGIYDYLGYNTTAYIGAELRHPGRTLPRSIIYAVFGIMVIYLAMQVGVLGAVRWQDMLDTNNPASQSVASVVLQNAWGKGTADTISVLILITAFASVFAGLLGGSRVPYDAARDHMFFASFGRLHRKHGFPTVSLLTMGVITFAGFYLSRHVDTSAHTPPLAVLIQLLTTVMVIVQAVSQIAAVTVLRRRQPTLRRPYRMWLYPLPSIIALAGWVTVYGFADRANPGLHPIEWSLAWVGLGLLAFVVWARVEHVWPFGSKEIRETFLDAQRATDAEHTAADTGIPNSAGDEGTLPTGGVA
jgi:fructoselysine transporter